MPAFINHQKSSDQSKVRKVGQDYLPGVYDIYVNQKMIYRHFSGHRYGIDIENDRLKNYLLFIPSIVSCGDTDALMTNMSCALHNRWLCTIFKPNAPFCVRNTRSQMTKAVGTASQ